MTKHCAIAGAKGGVGKTTIALNIACALAGFGRACVLVEGNHTSPHLGLHIGVPHFSISLADVIKKKEPTHAATFRHPSGFFFVPLRLADAPLSLETDQVKQLLESLPDGVETVLLDCGPALDKKSNAALLAAGESLVVTTPDMPSLTDALRTINFLEENGQTVLGVIVNRATGKQTEKTPGQIESFLEKPIMAVIPEDNCIRESLELGNPVVYTHPRSRSGIAFKKLAAGLIGHEFKDPLVESEKSSKLYSILASLGIQ